MNGTHTQEITKDVGPKALTDISNAIAEVRKKIDNPIGQCATVSLCVQDILEEKGYDTVVIDSEIQFPDTKPASHTYLCVRLPNVIDHPSPFLIVDPTIDQFTPDCEPRPNESRMVTTQVTIPEEKVVWPWDKETEWFEADHQYVAERWGSSDIISTEPSNYEANEAMNF